MEVYSDSDTSTFFLSKVNTSLQPLTQRQQLFQFFNDAFLFGKGWEGKNHTTNIGYINVLCSNSFLLFS